MILRATLWILCEPHCNNFLPVTQRFTEYSLRTTENVNIIKIQWILHTEEGMELIRNGGE